MQTARPRKVSFVMSGGTAWMFALALALVGMPANLWAQAVTGTVTDPAGMPLVAVSVSVEGTALGALTRDDGTYRVNGVPAGARVVVARRVGYVAGRQTVTVGTGEVTADFSLTPAPTSLEGVVTTATGAQRRAAANRARKHHRVDQRGRTHGILSCPEHG